MERLAADGSTYATALKAFSADGSATAYAATDLSADLVLTEPL
jgi:hypothetical protein